MHMLWKCMVSASNHCEVYRQQSSTQDLLNAIIYSVGRGRPWITGTGVWSNSIESATKTSSKFRQRCTSAHFAFQPATTTRCDVRPRAQASCYDDRIYIASRAPRFHKICDVIYWHLVAAAATGEWDGQFESRIAKIVLKIS